MVKARQGFCTFEHKGCVLSVLCIGACEYHDLGTSNRQLGWGSGARGNRPSLNHMCQKEVIVNYKANVLSDVYYNYCCVAFFELLYYLWGASNRKLGWGVVMWWPVEVPTCPSLIIYCLC